MFKKRGGFSLFTLIFVLLLGIFVGIRLQMIKHRIPYSVFSEKSYYENLVGKTYTYILENYVDSLSPEKLKETLFSQALKKMDPHSSYVNKEQFDAVNDPLKGNFEGIGVQFRVEKDTVVILHVIKGGPSQKVGIMDGDRIVTVDSDTIVGKSITNNDVIKRLKGKKNTKVNVGIFRQGEKKLLHYDIVRDVIPTFSVDAFFMANDDVGYVKLSSFSATSHKEVVDAIEELKEQGMEKMILDLRGNTGGYLQEAILLSDEFLQKDQLIVYTEGKHRKAQHAYATGYGVFAENPLVILVDEESASASEILAGAIQDNDRGLIIGRRSFGKGLVQEQVMFNDGSALRLTVARYYTPTGRSIQRPYEDDEEKYFEDIISRWTSGEMISSDSIHFNDSLIYLTPKGDTVYGGGGIMPNIFVPITDQYEDPYMRALIQKGMFYRYAFDYVDKNRKQFKAYEDADDYIANFAVSDFMLEQFLSFADDRGVKKQQQKLPKIKNQVSGLLKAIIGREVFENKAFYPLFLQEDVVYKKALETLALDKRGLYLIEN